MTEIYHSLTIINLFFPIQSLYSLQKDTKWEFPRKNLRFEEVIGQGEFGKVMSAMAIFNGSDPGRYFDLRCKNIQKGKLYIILKPYHIARNV